MLQIYLLVISWSVPLPPPLHSCLFSPSYTKLRKSPWPIGLCLVLSIHSPSVVPHYLKVYKAKFLEPGIKQDPSFWLSFPKTQTFIIFSFFSNSSHLLEITLVPPFLELLQPKICLTPHSSQGLLHTLHRAAPVLKSFLPPTACPSVLPYFLSQINAMDIHVFVSDFPFYFLPRWQMHERYNRTDFIPAHSAVLDLINAPEISDQCNGRMQ